jgi:uncharacterized OB-fold protein
MPSPRETVETTRFWQAAREGTLLYGSCRVCGNRHYYPRLACPFCLSDEVDWLPCSGMGEIYSYSVVRRATPPYVTAWVRLQEGITLFTNIVDCDADALTIGTSVKLVFALSTDGHQIPVFRPIGP